MAELWFWLLSVTFAVYIVLDGLDFGVGALHFVLGRSASERTTLLGSIGPVWDGNEVWLVAAGASLFAAFPALFAITFSGFYLPLMIVLWLLLFRALGIELRHQLEHPLWHQFWDVAFSSASVLLILFFGAALGNVVRGVALDEHGNFFAPLWTDFRVGAKTGILDWYTLLVAVTALATLSHHGALWTVLKTEHELRDRATRSARSLFFPTLALGASTAFATHWVQPEGPQKLLEHPTACALPLLSLAGLVTAGLFSSTRPLYAFLGSSVYVFFQVLSAAFAVFPHALVARDPSRHLALAAAASDPDTLRTMLFWWLPGMLLASGYSYYTYSRMPKTFITGDSAH
jgi:cytochrome d ubiquinol oxidase subunit II